MRNHRVLPDDDVVADWSAPLGVWPHDERSVAERQRDRDVARVEAVEGPRGGIVL